MTYNEQPDADHSLIDHLTALLTQLESKIRRAARSVSYQWPGVIDRDDVAQAIRLKLWESPGSLEAVTGMDDGPAYRALVGMGHQIAAQERSDYDYFKGSYRYSVSEVKDALGKGVLTEPMDGFDEVAFDLIEGLGALVVRAPRYAEAITERYADDERPDKDLLSRGLSALADAMNRSSRRRFSERDDGPGTRKAVSRVQALVLTDHEWDGDE